MKKILLLLVLLSNGIFASDRITLNMESYPLKEILHAIEERSSFYFIYNERLLDVTPLFSIAVEEETIHKTLEQLFRNTSIVYWISSPHIVLKDSSKNNNGIQGKIFDKETGETLIGATVIANDNNYAITNKFGYYAFKNTVEINELSVSHLGYQEQKKRLKIKPEQFENFYLETKTSQLNEVQVLSKVPWNNVLRKEETTTVIDEKKIANTPSFMGVPDIYAVLRSIPGVLSNGVGTSGFNIRGGNNDQNLILFEHVPFYESTHLFGLFSLFNPSTIASLKLYKGNIPARWGGRASSVMDIRLKDGNKNKFMVSGAIGPLTSQLQLEGPLKKKKVHFLMAARRTNIDYLSAFFNNKNPSNFYFYDLTGKLNFQINKNQTLVLSGFSGVDYYKSINRMSSTPLSYYLKQNALSLDWSYQSFKRTTVNFSSFYTKYSSRLDLLEKTSFGFPDTEYFGLDAKIVTFGSKGEVTYAIGKSNSLRSGFDLLNFQFKPKNQHSIETQYSFLKSEKAIQSSVFTEWEKKWPKCSFNIGLRWTGFYNTSQPLEYSHTPLNFNETNKADEDPGNTFTNFEPRGVFTYMINDHSELNINYNRMFQYIHRISNTTILLPLNVWKPSGEGVQPIEVNQWSIGFSHDLVWKNVRLNSYLEGYYKTLKNMIAYAAGPNNDSNNMLKQNFLIENGYAFGVEFNTDFNIKNGYGNFNYTYSRSFRKIPIVGLDSQSVQNIFYPTSFDRPHMLNFSLQKWLSKQLKISTFFTFQSGQPISIGFFFDHLHGGFSDELIHQNNSRLPPMHRLDFTFSWYPKKKLNTKWNSFWSFGIYNAYGRKNPISAYLDLDTNNPNLMKRYEFSPFGEMIPFISYHFNF